MCRRDAFVTLKQFSAQSGGSLLYSADAVEGVRTEACKAKSARASVGSNAAGTGLGSEAGRAQRHP